MKYSNKKFLVTGGAGFIGAAVAKKLINNNANVVILDNFSNVKVENIDFKCEIINENVSNKFWMKKIKDIDYILHFGSPSSVILFNNNPKKCLTDTIVGITNCFNYSKINCIKKIVYPSSSSVYGNTKIPQKENLKSKPVNLYGVAKLTCENIAQLYSGVVPSIGLRIFAGYGPGEQNKNEIASIITLFINEVTCDISPIIYGDGSQTRDFVYIDDIVKCIIKSIEIDYKGVVNVGSGENHNYMEILNLINKKLNKNINPIYVNKPKNYFENTLADIKLMRKLFEFHPLSLNEGLEKYFQNLNLDGSN